MANRARVALALAAAWGAGLVLAAVTLPVYSVESGASAPDGGIVTSTGSATLVEVNGPGVLLVAAAPLLATVLVAVLLRARPRHRVAGLAAWAPVGLLAGLAVLGLASVGVFLLPVVVALAIAVDAAPTPAVAVAQP